LPQAEAAAKAKAEPGQAGVGGGVQPSNGGYHTPDAEPVDVPAGASQQFGVGGVVEAGGAGTSTTCA
jgi:hypothetical protein